MAIFSKIGYVAEEYKMKCEHCHKDAPEGSLCEDCYRKKTSNENICGNCGHKDFKHYDGDGRRKVYRIVNKSHPDGIDLPLGKCSEIFCPCKKFEAQNNSPITPRGETNRDMVRVPSGEDTRKGKSWWATHKSPDLELRGIPLDEKIVRCPVILNNEPMKSTNYRHFQEKDVRFHVHNILERIDEKKTTSDEIYAWQVKEIIKSEMGEKLT